MASINWSFITSSEWNIDHPACLIEMLDNSQDILVPLQKTYVSERKGNIVLKCPAHTDFIKNMFVFYAPYDLTIEIDVNEKTGDVKINCPNLNQEQFDCLIDTRFLFDNQRGKSIYPMIGIDWLNIFQTPDSMQMQMLPAFMHYNDFTDKTTLYPGEFDIAKWTRPAEIVFECKKLKDKIEIKKGDAIAYFKFYSDSVVKMQQQQCPWEDIKLCNTLRNKNTFRPLKERYKSLAEIKGCPYDHKR
jgi:hypothetical protein